MNQIEIATRTWNERMVNSTDGSIYIVKHKSMRGVLVQQHVAKSGNAMATLLRNRSNAFPHNPKHPQSVRRRKAELKIASLR